MKQGNILEHNSKIKKSEQKNLHENPDMVKAPNVFQEYLNISCLTRDQLEVFECKDRFMYVHKMYFI